MALMPAEKQKTRFTTGVRMLYSIPPRAAAKLDRYCIGKFIFVNTTQDKK